MIETRNTLAGLMNESFERHAERTGIRVLRASAAKNEGLQYVPISYGQLRDQRDRLASGLAGIGIEKGARLGILTDGGLEPVLIFLAADLLGCASVPLCNKHPDDILVHSINDSRMQLLFVDGKSLEQVERVRQRLKHSPRIILTEGRSEAALSFFDLANSGRGVEPQSVEVHPDDESKVVYTSGSSGPPKGVIQTQGNIVANVRSVWNVISRRDPCVLFKSAPDYHTMGILNIYYPLAKGWVLDLARSPERVLTDIRHSQPHAFLTVPLVLDKVYGNVRKEIDAGGFKGRLVSLSVRAKQKRSRNAASLAEHLVYGTVGKRVVQKIRAKLSDRVGKNLEVLVVGSAKADPEALDFFQDVLDIRAFEGYGTTECCPLIATNHMEAQKTGTVGKPLLEVKLIGDDGLEVGYGDPVTGTYRGTAGRHGELWVSGSHVMKEYLGLPEETKQTLPVDETGKRWYRTGDLFSMDDEGFLTFRGRVGRQFKLSNGEFVNPERLERLYARIPLIEHVLVTGDQSRTFPLPIVTVNLEEARNQEDLLKSAVDDDEALRQDVRITDRIREQMLKEADRAGLPAHERPQRIVALPDALSEQSGTLTRGLKKVVPGAVLERYGSLVEEAYAK